MTWPTDRLSKRLTFSAEHTEALYAVLAEIDAVKNAFRLTDKLLPQTINRLTQSVIVTSTGASNRIEGNRLSDEEVEALYLNLRIRKFKTRDEQEVAGYLETLELILDAHADMKLSAAFILQLHRDMLKYSDKDERQRGAYKFGPNRVEAKDQSGHVVGVIFDPTPPHLTPKEMQDLVAWYQWAEQENFKHPLLRIGNFIFEYLAIHLFQDGNGRKAATRRSSAARMPSKRYNSPPAQSRPSSSACSTSRNWSASAWAEEQDIESMQLYGKRLIFSGVFPNNPI